VSFVFNNNQPFAVLGREQFESALEQQMTFELPHAGEAAYKAASRGEPLVLSNSGSAYSKAVEKLVHLLVPAEPKATQKRGFGVLHRPSAPKPAAPARQSSGLLGALRGKRAS
jgi:Flp pilus assembly CpaE family ATPase